MARQKISPWGFVGIGGMACVLFLVLATTTVAPWWVTLSLLALWGALLLLSFRWFLPHPARLPWLPAVVFAVWLPLISIGTRQWGWGA